MDTVQMRLPGVIYEVKHYRFTLLSRIAAEIEILKFDESQYGSSAKIIETGEGIGGQMLPTLEEALQDIVSRVENRLENTEQMQQAIQVYQSIGKFLDYVPKHKLREKNNQE